MFAHDSLISVPFFLAGSLKIAYDLLLTNNSSECGLRQILGK
jgi:hypothetical protein